MSKIKNINDKLRKSKLSWGFMIFSVLFFLGILFVIGEVEQKEYAAQKRDPKAKPVAQKAVEVPPIPVPPVVPIAPINKKQYYNLMKNYYHELMAMKASPDFWQGGYGSGLGSHWSQKVKKLEKRSYSLKKLDRLTIGVVPRELLSLGLEYVFSNGQETEASRWHVRNFEKSFKK